MTKRSPEDLGHRIASKLSIDADKTRFVITFEVDESKVIGLGGKEEKNKFYIKGDVTLKEGEWKAGPVIKDGTDRIANSCKGG